MIRAATHIALHFLAPAIVAKVAYANRWRYAWLVMVSTMLVDLDHFFANPLYDPDRCSIGFHPLHSWPVITIYIVMLALPKLRIIAIGLLIHMLLDTVDCLWMGSLKLI